MGRSTQGVKVMNIKDDDRVSAVALVVESDDAAEVEEDPSQVELMSSRGATSRCDVASDDGASPSGGAGRPPLRLPPAEPVEP